MTRHCGKCSRRWPRAAHYCPKCGSPESNAVEHLPATAKQKKLGATEATSAGASPDATEISGSLAYRLGATVGSMIKKNDPSAQLLGGLAGELLAVFLAPAKEPEREVPRSVKLLEEARSRRKLRQQREHEIELKRIGARKKNDE